jgi:Serine dehydrogenase proteinase
MMNSCINAQAPPNKAMPTRSQQGLLPYRPGNQRQNFVPKRKIRLLSRLGNWVAVRVGKFAPRGSRRVVGKRSRSRQRGPDGALSKRRLFSFARRIILKGHMTELEEFKVIVNGIGDKIDSDFYLFSDSIYDRQADDFIEAVRGVKKRRKNGSLVLCSNGGTADAAFQVARCIKKNYKKFFLYVFGNCKSAATLVAVGANDIVMSDCGQFGPLDVQLADKDEFFGQTPALDVSQSMTTLSEIAYESFSDCFLKLDPGRSMSTKTAVEIAKSLTLGIIGPIASQIDPLLLGRVDRSMKVAEAYIKRLNPGFKEANIKKLIGGYPSHEFVIDFDEAKQVFESVREPTEEEKKIEKYLRDWDRIPKQRSWIGVISDEKKEPTLNAPSVINGNGGGDGEDGKKTGQAAPTMETVASSSR